MVVNLPEGTILPQYATFTEYSTGPVKIGKWIDGRDVWRKVVDIGSLPSNSTKTIPHGITNINRVTKLYGAANTSGSNSVRSIPHADNRTPAATISVDMNTTSLIIGTSANLSSFSGHIVIEYTTV